MKPDAIDAILRQTLDDRRLSRGEKKALREILAETEVTPDELAFWRHRAFAVAAGAIEHPNAKAVLSWLDDTIKALKAPPAPAPAQLAEVHTSPGDACLDRIRSLISAANHSLDICVFTITDDRISRRIAEAHKRGIQVRVISDDDKSLDRGSDVERLQGSGVPVRTDRSPNHMHHKFAIFDGRLLVNGSYNWTRSAAERNEENIVVTDDQRLVGCFQAEFEKLWDRFR